eukprot:COSAG01_NODE_46188_length_402_cov_0.940594_1_plen_80_part_10
MRRLVGILMKQIDSDGTGTVGYIIYTYIDTSTIDVYLSIAQGKWHCRRWGFSTAHRGDKINAAALEHTLRYNTHALQSR